MKRLTFAVCVAENYILEEIYMGFRKLSLKSKELLDEIVRAENPTQLVSKLFAAYCYSQQFPV